MAPIIIIIDTIYYVIKGVKWLARKNDKEIIFAVKSFNRVVSEKRNLIPEIIINISGTEVQGSIAVTEYKIFNNGLQTIHANDIAKESKEDNFHLKIISENEQVTFLKAEITEYTKKENAFELVEFNNNIIKLKFDYLDKNQGIILKIAHTGYYKDIKIRGTIKGGVIKDIPYIKHKKTPEKKINLWSCGIAIGMILVVFLAFLCKLWIKKEHYLYANLFFHILILICEILFIIFPMRYIFRNAWIDIKEMWEQGEFRKKFRKNKPKENK